MLQHTARLLRTCSPLALLFWLMAALASLSFAIYIAIVWRDVYHRHEHQLRYINEILVRTSTDVFGYHQAMLMVLGERLLEIDAGRHPERGRELIEQALELNPSVVAFGLARRDGQLVLVSNLPAGTPLPNLAEHEASRESFQQAFTGTGMKVGHTYYMPALERWVIPIRLPIVDAAGRAQLVMTAGISAEQADTAWNALALPEAVEIVVLRDDGYLQYASAAREHMRQRVYSEQVPEELMARFEATRDSPGPAVVDNVTPPLRDEARMMVVKYLPEWNLYAITSKDKSVIYAGWRQRLVVPGLLYLLFLLGALLLYRQTLRLQRRFEDRLLLQAHYDGLTGLPNRFLALDRLKQSLTLLQGEKRQLAVVMLGLDHFKRINETSGRHAGDEMLRQVSERLAAQLYPEDTLARLGGDEFMILLPNLAKVASAEQRVERMAAAFQQPFSVDGQQMYSNVSIGVVLYPADCDNAEQLLQRAETAMSQAKERGRNGVCFYSRSIAQHSQRRRKIETTMRTALADGGFELYYQPQIALNTGAVVGLEALLRWQHAELGPLSPVEFIPVAEETGLINALGKWVLQQACYDMQHTLAPWPQLKMAVNVSTCQFHNPELVETVTDLLEKSGCPPERLQLEITESLFMADVEEHIAMLRRFREQGIGIAVDDFGTGYSSLSYIQRLPVSVLKIDKSFVHALHENALQATLTRSIISMGHSLGFSVIAEGVETMAQQVKLHEMGCEFVQGYLYSRPLALASLTDFLKAQGAATRPRSHSGGK